MWRSKGYLSEHDQKRRGNGSAEEKEISKFKKKLCFRQHIHICIEKISSGMSHVSCLCNVKLLDAFAGNQAEALSVSLKDVSNAFPLLFKLIILINIVKCAAWKAFIFIFVMERLGDETLYWQLQWYFLIPRHCQCHCRRFKWIHFSHLFCCHLFIFPSFLGLLEWGKWIRTILVVSLLSCACTWAEYFERCFLSYKIRLTYTSQCTALGWAGSC